MTEHEKIIFNKIIEKINITRQKKSFYKLVNIFVYLPKFTKLASGLALLSGLIFGYLYNNVSDYNNQNNTCSYKELITDLNCNTYINY